MQCPLARIAKLLLETCDIKQNFTAQPMLVEQRMEAVLAKIETCMGVDPVMIFITLVSEFPIWELIERTLLDNVVLVDDADFVSAGSTEYEQLRRVTGRSQYSNHIPCNRTAQEGKSGEGLKHCFQTKKEIVLMPVRDYVSDMVRTGRKPHCSSEIAQKMVAMAQLRMSERAVTISDPLSILEVGTHLGGCLLILFHLFPPGHVKAFGYEASPAAYRRALATLQRNGLHVHIRILPYHRDRRSGAGGVNDRHSESFAWSEVESGNDAVRLDLDRGFEPIRVEVETFSDLLALLPRVKLDGLILANSPANAYRDWAMSQNVFVSRFRYVTCNTDSGMSTLLGTEENVASACNLDRPYQSTLSNVRCRNSCLFFAHRIPCCQMSKKLLIEVGAYDGSSSLNYHRKGYEVITFEPKRDLFEKLQTKTSHLLDYAVHNYAISDINGEVDFHISRSGGASSLLPFKASTELVKHWGDDRWDVHDSNESYIVRSLRLQTFIESNNLTNREIDFIHVDAQGMDLKVLQSLGGYIANVREGVIEAASTMETAIYDGQTSTVQVCEDWLKSYGFRIKAVNGNDANSCEVNIFFSRA